jgi:hypothetical protein
MQPFPYHYRVDTSVAPEGDAPLTYDGVEEIALAPTKEFGALGSRWSPEALLTAAAADYFGFNFPDIAGFSRTKWISLRARTMGTVDCIRGELSGPSGDHQSVRTQ